MCLEAQNCSPKIPLWPEQLSEIEIFESTKECLSDVRPRIFQIKLIESTRGKKAAAKAVTWAIFTQGQNISRKSFPLFQHVGPAVYG